MALHGLHLTHHFFAAAAFQHFHHFLHLLELFEELVDFEDFDAGAVGNADAAAAVEDVGFAAFFECHREDDRFGAFHCFFGVVVEFDAAQAGHHAEDALHGAEFFDLLHLGEEVFEVEVCFAHFFGHAFGFFFVDDFLGFFDERNDVAHAEDAGGEAVGIKGFEVGGFFAGADKFDGYAGDVFDGEGGASACIAVEFGEDKAGQLHGFVEGFGNVDGFLSEGAVGDEEYFVGLDAGAEFFDFFDEVLVDLEASGGVEEDCVGAGGAGGLEAGGADGGYVFGNAVGVEAEVFLFGEDFELVDGGGAVDVAADEEGFVVAAFFEEFAEFGGGGGFA